MQVDDQVRMRLTSQLKRDISRVLQKSPKCFNETSISTSFVLPAPEDFPLLVTLDLNNSESLKVAFGSSL